MKPVKVKDAPGLVWKKRGEKYEARWQARTDLIAKGWSPKSERLWHGTGEPSSVEWNLISDRCRMLQSEMLVWSRGGLPTVITFDGTLDSLLKNYQKDADSPYRELRYKSRKSYDTIMGLIVRDYGTERLSELSGRAFKAWHRKWAEGGKTSISHAKIGMLRILFGFGATILEDKECERLSGVLGQMRFPMAKPRTERLSAEQATAIRATAHELGRHSIALAQAFQFECMLRQKDVIGEWVPMEEPGLSDTTHEGMKWLRGIRWEEIDGNLILRHTTSKRLKEVEWDLRGCPMVMEELALLGVRPDSGPIVIYEKTKRPWSANEFRRYWRQCADAAGVPKSVRNMDSRAGAISEATDAGAELEHVRHAATHSNISMTQRYSRNQAEKIAGVQKQRIAHRNKPGT
jgi:hypothetical protein